MSIGAMFMEEDTTAVGPPATTAGDRDAGQARCETLANAIAEAGIGQVRYTTPSGKRHAFKCSVNTGGPSGGNNDVADWTAEFTRTGVTTVT